MQNNRTILDSFDVKHLPDLDVAVLGALELFQNEVISKLETTHYQRPLVVGSGNAEATGRIIFHKTDAVFASESDFEDKLKHIASIDGVILISSSGGKHAPGIVTTAHKYGKKVTLITNTLHSLAGRALATHDSEYIFPKNREPYTYNTSTYMGMILGATAENPKEIEKYIHEHIETLVFPDFSRYDKFFIIVPPQFSGIIRMLNLKFVELFGRKIARDIETSEYTKHACTVIPEDELFISFGEENILWGKAEHRLHIPLPQDAQYGAMMAIGYYVVGLIQRAHPAYFKDNIVEFTDNMSKLFGQEIKPIVD